MANDEAASAPSPALSPEQTRALFDILTHHETYHEIASFKFPDTISSYGYPFKRPSPEGDEVPTSSSAPILQLLLTRTVLPLPGVSQLPPEFWNARVQSILARLGEAELSESYDKGAMGTRKVLATGSSAIVEMLGRGMLGGVDRKEAGADTESSSRYDHAKADDLERAWDNVVQGLVYGDLADQVFDHFVRSDDLETLSPMAEAAVRHIIFHLATLIHQIFVLSPEGQYLLKLIENVHSLVPFKMIKQTLRIGNAATMINGMMRILLAKLSVASVTNWVGLTQNADDGMNLLQRIISLVLSWDSGEFKKSAERVEKGKAKSGGPSDEMLRLIREHVEGTRLDHETVRSASERNSQSIITSIFDASSNPQLSTGLTESQHAQCLEYYSSLLSVRDRDRITSAFCRQSPDALTQAVRDFVAAYDPMIRTVHANVDLREHFDSLQGFIEAFIKTSRPGKGGSSSSSSSIFGRSSSSSSSSSGDQLPCVEDYVDLLMRHRGLLYKWIHALASRCPDLWEDFRVWGNRTLVKFQKRPPPPPPFTNGTGATAAAAAAAATDKTVPGILNQLYAGLGAETRTRVGAAIDSHATYLSALRHTSKQRLQCLVAASGGRSTAGPGVYLSRWQALLDKTPITPSQPRGRVRRGKDVKHTTTMGKTGVGGKKVEVGVGAAQSGASPEAPDVSVVVDALADPFRREVQQLAAQIAM